MRFKNLIAVCYMDGEAVGETELEVSRVTRRNIYVPFYPGATRAYVVPKSKVYTDDYGRKCFDVNDNTEYADEREELQRKC